MKELCRILEMSDTDLGMYLKKELKTHYNKVHTDGDNYLYVRGKSPICLVAHIDTVRNHIDNNVVLKINRNIITNTKGILGADDRAGVYGILQVMRDCMKYGFPMPHIIFTNYEERGGKGVKAFIKSKKFNPEGIKLLVELDRKGCNEYVYYSSTLPKPVADYVESFGFKKENGSYSDISDLTDEYLIPSVNLSIGYYAQHTFNEKLHYDEMLMTVDRVVDMCEDPIAELHPVPKAVKWANRYGTGDWDEEWSYYSGCRTRTTFAPRQPTTGAQQTLPAVVGKKQEVSIETEIERKVMNLLLEVKEDLKTEITTVFNVDTVAAKFLDNEHALLIADKLDRLLEAFNDLYCSDITGVRAFHIAWNKTVMRDFYSNNRANIASI